MKIGIIGAGAVGHAFATQLLKIGHSVMLANRRGPASLESLVRELGNGARAGTSLEAARAQVVILAVPWKHLKSALIDLPRWDHRIVIDATNPIIGPGLKVAALGGRGSSEVVAELLAGARVVKAGNTLPAGVLAADPRGAGGRRVLFISGDDDQAKVTVRELLNAIGFFIVDLGTLQPASSKQVQ